MAGGVVDREFSELLLVTLDDSVDETVCCCRASCLQRRPCVGSPFALELACWRSKERGPEGRIDTVSVRLIQSVRMYSSNLK